MAIMTQPKSGKGRGDFFQEFETGYFFTINYAKANGYQANTWFLLKMLIISAAISSA